MLIHLNKLCSTSVKYKCFYVIIALFYYSEELGCTMRFAIYLPPAAEEHKVPAIYWLSGLTCTEKNFIEKAGAQQHAASKGVIIVAPDTSPSMYLSL